VRRAALGILAAGAALAGCRSCARDEDGKASTTEPSPPDAAVVAEELTDSHEVVPRDTSSRGLPRCRGEAERIALPGEDVVVGDVAIGGGAIYAGLVRRVGAERVASVLRTPLDLSTSRVIDLGAPFGDDPPPSPRLSGTTAHVAFYGRRSSDAGARVRELTIARLEDDALGKVEATIVQQADESTAFDVAWNDAGAGLVAWDEDAPPNADAGSSDPEITGGRGFVKVQAIGSPSRRVASPETSDAESPRLLARPDGGFWLAWLARRVEEERWAVEGPGERRAYRWVEAVALTATGELAGPVRRASSEKGRAAGFELGSRGDDLVVLVQDENAPSEGGGARIVRHVLGAKVDSSDVVDAGVGSAVAELVAAPGAEVADGGARWLAFTDPAERARLAPFGRGLLPLGPATGEPALDGARVVAAAPADRLYALVLGASDPSAPSAKEGARPELRRFTCAALPGTPRAGAPK
jgi:hypothetical protein